ncbi:MAG TPA: WecB/TagA/CpsF family glycosyltransferase [Ktedonobacterales bacterium]
MEEPHTPARTQAELGDRQTSAHSTVTTPDHPANPSLRRQPLPIDPLTLAATAERVCALVEAGQCAHVVTLNPELVMRARRDQGLARVIGGAQLVTADGAGIVWALRLAGQRIPERVTGVDLALSLAELAAARGLPVFLLGAAPGVAEATARALTRRLPDLRIVGYWDGTPRPRDDAEAIRRIRATGARIALVAYGAPRQELWIARTLPALPGIAAVGVGGAFDMLSGRLPRAPHWMRMAGLEWLFRLARQPWRWRRMLALPRFALLAGGAALAARLTQSPDAGILAIRDPEVVASARD